MISLDTIHAANIKLVNSQAIVAVFIGATSGIGEYGVRALADAHGTHGKGLRLYLVGRKEEAANKIFAECRKICPAGQFIFVTSNDLSLLKGVDRVSSHIMSLEETEASKNGGTARIDFLVMCQGIVNVSGSRQDTAEGLDTMMSLIYYSRMRFILQLMPLLLKSTSPTGARVVSVFGPGSEKKGRENKIWPDDLSLRNPVHYGFINLGDQVAYMKTFFMEYIAKQYPGKISLIHYFPGLVMTPAFQDTKLPFWFRASFTVAKPMLSFMIVAKEETGARLVFLASERYPARDIESKSVQDSDIAISSDEIIGGGAYRVKWTGDKIPVVPEYVKHRKEGLPELCVKHTLEVFEEIEAGGEFKG